MLRPFSRLPFLTALLFALPAAQAETRILFCSDKETGSFKQWELYTMRADGSDLKRVTNTVRSEWAPALSPDNHTLAFIDNLNTGTDNLWLTDLDGSEPVRVPISSRALAVQWADEDTLFFMVDVPGGPLQQFQIWEVDTDGENERAVFIPVWDIFPTGADSFQYHRGLDRLFFCARIPLPTPSLPFSGSPESITFDSVFDPCEDPDFLPQGPLLDDHYDVAISPDATTMAYAADFLDGSHRMYVRSADGDCSTQRRLSDGFTGDPDWSPDSQWIAFTQAELSTFGRDPYIGDIFTARRDGSTLDDVTGDLERVNGRCAHALVYEAPNPPLPFSILSVIHSPTRGTAISWPVQSGLLYQVEYSEDLNSWRSDLPDSNILAPEDTPFLTYIDETSTKVVRRYYRVIAANP